ncbi:hypothetical protein JRO89_XS02G0199800 [Xanthoceras sorbifolium]|uniref:Zinc knuckle CX2CX4HX4C domain-containing protein n=1 Tax=Xanthoceras sorbifolium TaxID=99658 RepID=A0ABQ8IG87_9ROSI|nr:hypothetical protein JRO89_XS02G0199800 [Xanthoceras sorbifolium]
MTLKIGRFLGSQIGTVREVDAGASGDCLGKYIRVRVEIDIGKPLQRFLKVNLGSSAKDVVMLLRYERLPEYCFECGMVSHSIRECDCGLGPGGRGKDEVAYGLWMRAVSPVKTRNGRGTRESVPAEVESEEVPAVIMHGPGGGCDVGALTKRPTTSTLHGNVVCMGDGSSSGPSNTTEATPEYPVAVVGDAGTAGKVDITGGRRWKRRARARGEQDIRMGQEDIGGKRMGYLVCVDSDHGPKRS